ncbi:MAG TPA: hypothetical protein VMF09_10165 [Solirubrobacteraceae bacterium]|nr:hypothetical protein [Solirubrobacteraceae bacterium]
MALDELGWRQFLDLCIAVIQLEAGVDAGAWVGEQDRFYHVTVDCGLELAGAGRLSGPCHVQALWIADGGTMSRAASLESELLAVRETLSSERWTGSLALLTNYAGVFADHARLCALFGSDRLALLGPGWLSERIDRNPRLRRLMPSLLSLGDMERWLAGDRRTRHALDIAGARALSEVFVPTGAYRRALEVLDAHRFAVLTGPPEMGKTSIARMIALALVSNGWEAFECTAPQEVQLAFEPARSQVFIADDAFGSTEYRPDVAERWAREMDGLPRAMDERHFLIWTSRPAPLRAGLRRIHRERGAERFPQPGAVLVDAGGLSLDEKVLILLRHAKAKVPRDLRRRFREAGYAIVSHPHFTPERIRRLVSSDLHTMLHPGSAGFEALIEWHIQTPTEAMAASFNALSGEHRAVLIAMLDAPPGPVEERELARLARLHSPTGLSRPPIELVDRLSDHFLRVTDTLKVDWVHPSWRDLVIDALRGDAQAREAFLKRCTLEGVLLALSGAGGSSGTRTLALLRTDRDWDLLTDQVVRVIRCAADVEVIRLLDGLAAAAGQGDTVEPRDHEELCALVGSALEAARRRCERDPGVIDVDLLGPWLRLARELPEAPLPSFDRTWSELLPVHTSDLRERASLDRAIAWLELRALLEEHLPDALRAYGPAEQDRSRIAALVDQATLLLADESVEAAREELVYMLRLCRRVAVHRTARVAELDNLIWEASRERGTERADPALALPEASVRRHVELILEDL